MSNPSTVWTQLSLPNSPIGSVPFVDVDGVTIITDVANFFYTKATAQSVSGSGIFPAQLTALGGLRVGFLDTTGVLSPAVTINQPSGRLNIPPSYQAVVVTNSYCVHDSLILLQLIGTGDATLTRVNISSIGDGQFIIFGNAAATNTTIVTFLIVNTNAAGQ